MLKKINRISKRVEFEEIKKDGVFVGFSRFFGIVKLDKKDEKLKFGVIISKKISKKAVERNKIRRRLMEVLGRNLSKFGLGKRILFLVKKDMLGVKPDKIEEEINRILKPLCPDKSGHLPLKKGENKNLKIKFFINYNLGFCK